MRILTAPGAGQGKPVSDNAVYRDLEILVQECTSGISETLLNAVPLEIPIPFSGRTRALQTATREGLS